MHQNDLTERRTSVASLRVAAHLIVGLSLLAGPASLALPEEAASRGAVPPELEFAFEEIVTLASEIKVGTTPYGERNIVPITGGTFSGPNIEGRIRPGGWDWQLATGGGCFLIKADYMIQADDGTTINVLNTGRFCRQSTGDAGRGLTTPVFEAPIGKHDWLNGGTFVGMLDGTTLDGKPAVRIRFYKAK